MPPLLSLCVPTYNHAPLLARALRAILSQVTPELRDFLEVVLLDNASPDDTPAVVTQAQADFPDVVLRCIRRAENVGPDANFCDAVTQARGEFLLLLSDDDVLLPGAVGALLAILQAQPHLDAIALNARPFWASPDEASSGIFRIEEDRVLMGRDAALLFLQMHITFLSCIAFRRREVSGRDYTPRYATNLAQSYMFLDALAPGRGMYVIQEPYLAQQVENNVGYDFFRVFVTNFHDLMRHAQSIGYSPQTVRQMTGRHLRFLCYAVCVFKSKGTLGEIRPHYRDGLARLWRAYGPNPLLVPVVLLVLTPRVLFVLLFSRAYALFRQARAWQKRRHGPSGAALQAQEAPQ